MDLDALRFADFGPLDDAVDDWSTMIRDLEALEKSADKGLRRSANKANWSGVNATVSREFIGKTAGEFTDALGQAKSVRNILRDTCSELKGYQTKLKDAIDRGHKKNLTVTSTGDGGFTVTMNIHPDRAAKGTTVPEHGDSDVTALRDEVQKILDDATKSDSSANTVLRALADQSAVGFSDAPVYKDRDAADKAVTTANELAKLAKKKPEDLTPQEFDRLNQGLKLYANDELFADRFASRLGARGTLDFWTGLTDPHRSYEIGRERSEKYDELQKNLSLTLAAATQSDSAAMVDWKTRMIDLADKPMGQRGGFPLGGQVMSNLMRWGNYDDRFLVQYGEKLIDVEKEFTGNGRYGAWNRTGTDSLLNRTGSDSGSDPMTGYLKALSNNPDAATTFFTDTFVTKEEDHDFTKKVDGKEVSKSLTNFEYFFEERDWPNDKDDEGEDSIAGRNNLALALEAATTGHPAGEMPTVDTPPHNEEQAKLFQNLTSSVKDDITRITNYGYMSDSLGQITAEYLPDINRAITNDLDKDTDRLFPIAGSAAELDHQGANALLVAVGQNPEGYAAVEVANKAYMANLMDYHMNSDLPADQRYSNDTEFAITELARGSGEISGTLAIGRQEAVTGPADEDDKKYGQAVAQWKNSVSGAVGIGIGVGAAFVASPIAGAAVGGAATTVSSLILEELFQNAEGDAKKVASEEAGERWESGLETNSGYTEKAAEHAAKLHDRKDLIDESIDEKARAAAQAGFRNAGVDTEFLSDHLTTEI